MFTAGSEARHEHERGVTTVKLRRRFDDPARHEKWFGRRLLPHLVRGRFDAVHSMMAYDAWAAVRTRPLAGHRAVYEELGSPISSYWDTIPDGKIRRRLVSRVDVYGCMSNFSLADLCAPGMGGVPATSSLVGRAAVRVRPLVARGPPADRPSSSRAH